MDKAHFVSSIEEKGTNQSCSDTDSSVHLGVPMFRLPSIMRPLEQVITQRMVAVSQVLDMDDDEASIIQTVALRTIAKKQSEKKIRAFFANFVHMIVSVLLLGGLIVTIIVIPGYVYKAAITIIFLITCSYVLSVQLKYAYQVRQERYLTMAQFLRLMKRASISDEEDMKHFKLVEQDTQSYLHVITAKRLKKGARL